MYLTILLVYLFATSNNCKKKKTMGSRKIVLSRIGRERRFKLQTYKTFSLKVVTINILK